MKFGEVNFRLTEQCHNAEIWRCQKAFDWQKYFPDAEKMTKTFWLTEKFHVMPNMVKSQFCLYLKLVKEANYEENSKRNRMVAFEEVVLENSIT